MLNEVNPRAIQSKQDYQQIKVKEMLKGLRQMCIKVGAGTQLPGLRSRWWQITSGALWLKQKKVRSLHFCVKSYLSSSGRHKLLFIFAARRSKLELSIQQKSRDSKSYNQQSNESEWQGSGGTQIIACGCHGIIDLSTIDEAGYLYEGKEG